MRRVLWATFAATLLFPLDFAIILGVFLSLIIYLRQASRPSVAVRVPDPREPRRRFSTSAALPQCPQFAMVRIDGALFFGAVSYVAERLRLIAQAQSAAEAPAAARAQRELPRRGRGRDARARGAHAPRGGRPGLLPPGQGGSDGDSCAAAATSTTSARRTSFSPRPRRSEGCSNASTGASACAATRASSTSAARCRSSKRTGRGRGGTGEAVRVAMRPRERGVCLPNADRRLRSRKFGPRSGSRETVRRKPLRNRIRRDEHRLAGPSIPVRHRDWYLAPLASCA